MTFVNVTADYVAPQLGPVLEVVANVELGSTGQGVRLHSLTRKLPHVPRSQERRDLCNASQVAPLPTPLCTSL